jgi:hypothetical protein
MPKLAASMASAYPGPTVTMSRPASAGPGESHCEVVQAQRGPADQQSPPVPGLRDVVAAAQGLDESPDRGREQYPGAGPAGGGPQRPARPVPMSIPVAGMTTSHKPKTVATLISVRRSTPLTPMAIAAPKLFSPSATATTKSATIVN